MKKSMYLKDKSSGGSSPSRDSSEYFQYIKRLSSAKRENQELRDGLRGINRSLDKIIKETKTPLRFRYVDTGANSDQDLYRKIESTELLITKYKKEINSIKETAFPDNQNEKSQLVSQVSALKLKLAELEKENSKLKTSEKKIKLFDGAEAKKVIQDYKSRCLKLIEIIKEDDDAITQFKKKIKNLKNVANHQKVKSIDSSSAIEDLENKINELEIQKKTEENIWKQKISQLKLEIDQKSQEISDLSVIFKDKDKICRIKRMKIKAQERENRSGLKGPENQSEYDDN